MIVKDLNESRFGQPFKKLIQCKCGSREWDEAVEQFKNKSIHIRGTCKKCGSFIQWIPYTESHIIKSYLISVLEGGQ